MKKLIALTFAMLFLGAGIASATDFSLSGSYYARGSYYDNMSGQGIDVESFAAYDHELSVDAVWQIDDTTKVFARFEMVDETWGQGAINEINLANNDDNLYVEQVWAAHTFGNGGTLTVGKMSAGAWATAFHNAGDEGYRVKWVQPTGIGTVIGILQKNDNGEGGNTVVGEDNDQDIYILALVTKFGDISVKPLFVYVDLNSAVPGADRDIIQGHLGLDGAFGNMGFEAELNIDDIDFENPLANDAQVYGAYLNLWMNADALKVGGLFAYGSYDSDAGIGFDFGDDFEAGGALIMGDDATFFGGNDLTAGTLFAIYADYAVSDQLSLGGYFGYATCNVDNNGYWDGASIYEISVDATYAITANLSYKVAAGYAQLEPGDNSPDPDEAMELYHKLSFSF